MMEYSTLTSWGSNPQTFLVNIKSATADQVKEAVDFVRKAFLQHGYSDERLKGYDMELSLLLKSLNGGAVVSCPHCGHQFDYDAETEHTFAQQVLDYAADYQRWITQDIVREEMEKLTPEIRTQVISLIDSVKSEKKEFTQKGLQDLMNYVRCPTVGEKYIVRMLFCKTLLKIPPEKMSRLLTLKKRMTGKMGTMK
jgi:predicted RNA-binding Zn-ribbon protein involved in translation (DUF1610 family)